MNSIILLSVLLFSSLVSSQTPPPTPVWPKQYTLNGSFTLPYWAIDIPIQISYDGVNNRETLDYYQGTDTYVWRFDIQTLYQVVPRIDKLTCFVSNGIGSGPMVTLLPDLTNWTWLGPVTINGVHANYWGQYVTTLNKTAQYLIYVNPKGNIPIQLVLQGYDFVFGSHPDQYVFNFDQYTPNYVDASVFDEPEICSNATKETAAGTLRAQAHLGKLGMLTPPKSEDSFHIFTSKYGKSYSNAYEYAKRRAIHHKNTLRINKHNADPQSTFKMAMNHLGDYTDDEIQMLLMPKLPLHLKEQSLSGATQTHELSNEILPPYVNWIQKGAVNKIKDQGICGSCWTFGTIGSIEGAWFVKTGDLLDLSEQQLIDCNWGAWGSGNSGCDGGFAGPAMQWIIDNNGIALEDGYRYLSEDGWCNANKVSGVVLKGYVNVTSESEEALQDAVSLGPVAVAIDAAHPEFEYYSGGIYYNPKCNSSLDALDHEVLVVGYGTENGQDYWLVRNSWSTWWGDNGYIKMARNRDNNCGIATQATYPLV